MRQITYEKRPQTRTGEGGGGEKPRSAGKILTAIFDLAVWAWTDKPVVVWEFAIRIF